MPDSTTTAQVIKAKLIVSSIVNLYGEDVQAWSLLCAELSRLELVEQAAADYMLSGMCGDYSQEIPGARDLHDRKFKALLTALRTNGDFDA